MRVTIRKVISLALAFALCTAFVVWLNLPQGGEVSEPETVYYFANYDSAEDILAVQIDNPEGNVTLISSDGTYYAYLGETEVQPAEDAAGKLFSAIFKLPLISYLAGASSKDSQYGLEEPLAEVYIQNKAGDAFMFYIGRASPSRSAYYVCLAGDDRVFLMSAEKAELFLSDPKTFCKGQ